MQNRIVAHYKWDITQGDYKAGEVNYVIQHSLAKHEKEKHNYLLLIALSLTAVSAMLIVIRLAATIRI